MISVCIATCNGEEYIRQQIESILPQLEKEDEVVISDDDSTDNTLEIIKNFEDKRIKILPVCTFKSPIWNFENAIKNAKGDYIFLSDQDDVWLPNKVTEFIKALSEKNIVMSDALIFYDSSNPFGFQTLKEWRRYKKGFFQNLWKPNYVGCCMAFNRSKLNQILPFPDDVPAHDVWIGLLGEITNDIFYLDKPLINYRRHGNNYSNVAEKSHNDVFFMIKYRLQLFFDVLRRVGYNK